MSRLGEAMKRKGYIPLADDGRGAIGFKSSLNTHEKRLAAEVWFDIGRKMKDAEGKEHPMTVMARSEAEYNEYVKKGWKPVPDVSRLSKGEGALEAEKKEDGKEEEVEKEEEKEMKKRGKK